LKPGPGYFVTTASVADISVVCKNPLPLCSTRSHRSTHTKRANIELAVGAGKTAAAALNLCQRGIRSIVCGACTAEGLRGRAWLIG